MQWWRRLRLGLILFAAVSSIGGFEARAVSSNIAYGYYCGFGNFEHGKEPVDAIDRACMEHDSCVRYDLFPRCGCHVTFEKRMDAIARERRQTPFQRETAQRLKTAVAGLPCIPL